MSTTFGITFLAGREEGVEASEEEFSVAANPI
jgi:hypothetical protein